MADKKTRGLIRKNKHSPVLKLWLNKESLNGATAMAMEHNNTIHTVSIFLEEDYMENSHEQLMVLFDEIGRLPLRNLYIYSFGSNYDVFPIKLLLHLFDYAAHLEVLALYFVEIGGCQRYFKTFEELIKNHQHLKEFRLENCRLSDEILGKVVFDKFLTSIATLPKIETIDLCAAELGQLGEFTPAGLTKIGSLGDSLKCLNLNNFVFTNQHITALSEAINSNPMLEELSITCDPRYCNNMAPMLATNKTLKEFKLKLDDFYDGAFLHQVALGLEENKSITRFELVGDQSNIMSRKSQRYFADMLEKNCTIEELEVNITDDEIRKKVQYYLKLNQTGKRTVMEDPNADHETLIDALAFVNNDLDMLNHFLKTKPSMSKA